jgi:hypothetical protein
LGGSFQRAFKYRDESNVNDAALCGMNEYEKSLRRSAFLNAMTIR